MFIGVLIKVLWMLQIIETLINSRVVSVEPFLSFVFALLRIIHTLLFIYQQLIIDL